ncbi:MAG: endonuclease III [Elusimicrobia bacterium]|nr:endonuclease III [Elusimicrobiota bacterium]
MRDADIHSIVPILKREVRRWKVPVVGVVAEDEDPFLVLVSTLLSLRTKDAVTEAAGERLFKLARTPEALLKLPLKTIERAIYPVCFYRVKAKTLRGVARDLIDRFDGRVPDDLDALLSLKGVGRKTANLVVTLGFRKPGICVDIHVHRISNRLGYVRTKTPDETEAALREKLPRKYWMIFNDLLVPYGQNLCAPVSPWCSRCKIAAYCKKRGVTRSR